MDGSSPLHWATDNIHEEIVGQFISIKCMNINVTDKRVNFNLSDHSGIILSDDVHMMMLDASPRCSSNADELKLAGDFAVSMSPDGTPIVLIPQSIDSMILLIS
jgi:hypothetical protein